MDPVFRVSKMLEGERDKLAAAMEEGLHKRGIGQHEVMVAVSMRWASSPRALSDPKPAKSALLHVLGPTGVGKTELFKRRWPQFLFDTEEAMVRIDYVRIYEKQLRKHG